MGVTMEVFGKKAKDLTQEERRVYSKLMYEKYKKPFNTGYMNTNSYKLFGKRRKDLSPDELRALNTWERHHGSKFKNKAASSFAVRYFGKRFRDMSMDEKHEYWAIRKKIHIQRKKNGTLPGRGYYVEGE